MIDVVEISDSLANKYEKMAKILLRTCDVDYVQNNLSYFEEGCNYIHARIEQEHTFGNPINHVGFSQKKALEVHIHKKIMYSYGGVTVPSLVGQTLIYNKNKYLRNVRY